VKPFPILSTDIYIPIVNDTTDQGYIEASSLEAPEYVYDYLANKLLDNPNACQGLSNKTLIVDVDVNVVILKVEATVYTFDDNRNLIGYEPGGEKLVNLLIGESTSTFAFMQERGSYDFRIVMSKLCKR
jgi:hypothetical protein